MKLSTLNRAAMAITLVLTCLSGIQASAVTLDTREAAVSNEATTSTARFFLFKKKGKIDQAFRDSCQKHATNAQELLENNLKMEPGFESSVATVIGETNVMIRRTLSSTPTGKGGPKFKNVRYASCQLVFLTSSSLYQFANFIGDINPAEGHSCGFIAHKLACPKDAADFGLNRIYSKLLVEPTDTSDCIFERLYLLPR